MRAILFSLCMLFGYSAPVYSAPDISIGITLSSYPRLSRVPGYPVYYAPGLQANYFFYDGWYWVYLDDNWYASRWYNGPWELVIPDAVPLYVLRVPVRYYRAPPPYFVGWRHDAPPRWHDHWGNQWAQKHRGWDRWDRRRAPAPAPLPSYQRRYSGNTYPQAKQGSQLSDQHYRHRPRDPVLQQRAPHQAAAKPGPRVTLAPAEPVRIDRAPRAQPQPQPQPQPQMQQRPQPQAQPKPQHGPAQPPPPARGQQQHGHGKDKDGERGQQHNKGKGRD